MSEPNNELIFKTLLDQNQQLGRIEATTKAMADKLDYATKAHAKVESRVLDLEKGHNKMKGAAMVWSLVVSAVVSAVGWYLGAGGGAK
jgi:hypothetical protein